MIRILAHFFSIVLHPLIILTYMLIILLLVNPYLFGVNTISDHTILILLIFFSTFFIPAVAVIMMRLLGLISSLRMEDPKERIGPYIATGIFYMWLFRNLLDNPDIPIAYKIFVLGATIGLFVAFFINNFSKISMHGVGMGGFLAMLIITSYWYSYGTFTINAGGLGIFQISTTFLIMLGIILTGIVSSSRLYLNAHSLSDITGGLFVGFVSQFLAVQFLI